MKKGLLLFAIILLSASVASAQLPGGAVGVYSDNAGTSCNFLSNAPGLVSFYYYHLSSPGATAIEFQADLTGFNYSSFLGDISPFTLKQNPFHSGTSIAYGACLSNNIYLGAANYLGAGTTPTCQKIFVTVHPVPSTPGATTPLMVNCSDALIQVSGSYGIFNNDGSCLCTGSVPVNESSWGQIKSLYN
jgi:hypothetical protein